MILCALFCVVSVLIHPLADYLNQVQQRSQNLKDSVHPLGASQRPSEGAPGGERRGSQLLEDDTRRVVIEKVNMLLLGPTGSGMQSLRFIVVFFTPIS